MCARLRRDCSCRTGSAKARAKGRKKRRKVAKSIFGQVEWGVFGVVVSVGA
jgi:hypothetical protein